MALALRPYQQEAVGKVFSEWAAGNRRTLVVQATGTGKTVVFATVAKRIADHRGRTLVLAHRGELLDQATDKIMTVTGIRCAREQATESAHGSASSIVVGSVQTLCREARLKSWNPREFDSIIIDEAHHALSDSYQRVLDYFDCSKILGVTATSDRADKKNLGEYFDSVAYEYDLAHAIKDGYLSPIRTQTIPLDIDISKVSTAAGDYAAGELGNAIDPYLDSVADIIATEYADKHTLIFLPLVRTAKAMCAKLRDRGVVAEEVDGKSDDRSEVIDAFSRGEIQVLCNSMLLTEGWDCPAVDCIAILRPTQSRALYAQMVGRGTRLSPDTGKDHLLLLDFLWLTEDHELCRPTCLITKDKEVANKAAEDAAEAAKEGNGFEVDIMDAYNDAAKDVARQREEKLAEELAAQRHKKAKLIDPLEYELTICDRDLSDYRPSFAWEMKPPTARQLEVLEQRGFDPAAITTRGMASKLIDIIKRRNDAGLATPKQIFFLKRQGYEGSENISKAAAGRMIGAICDGNGRRGWGVRS